MKTRTFDIGFGVILPIALCIALLIGFTQIMPIKVEYEFPEMDDELVIDSAIAIAVNTVSWNRACPQEVGIYYVDYDSDYNSDYPWQIWLDIHYNNPNSGYPMYFKTLEDVKSHLKLVLYYDLTEGM